MRSAVVNGEWWVGRRGRPWPRPLELAVAMLLAASSLVAGVATSAATRSAVLALDAVNVESAYVANGQRGADGCVSISYCVRSFAVDSRGQVVETVQASTQTYSTPGTFTWNVPTGVTSAVFDVKGAGGGSGGVNAATSSGLNGYRGGHGGRSQGTLAVTGGDAITVVVGGGGGGGSVSDTSSTAPGGSAGTSAAASVGAGGAGADVTGTGAGRKASGGGGGGRSVVSRSGTDYFIAGGGGGSGGMSAPQGGSANGGTSGGGGSSGETGIGRTGSDGLFTWTPANPGSNGSGGAAASNSIPQVGNNGTATNGGSAPSWNSDGGSSGGGGGGGWGGGGSGLGTAGGTQMSMGGGGGDGFMHASVTSQTFTTGGGGEGGAGVIATSGNSWQSAGNGGTAGSVVATYTAPPSQPGAFVVPASSGSYPLAALSTDWGDSTASEGGSLTYELYYRLNGGGQTLIATGIVGSAYSWTPPQVGSYVLDVYARESPSTLLSVVRQSGTFTIVKSGSHMIL